MDFPSLTIKREAKKKGRRRAFDPDFGRLEQRFLSVLVHKDDLDLELPPKDESPVAVACGADPRDGELIAEYERLRNLLLARIRGDRFVKGRSGKLLGALLELPSYLDRATSDLGEFRLAYPEGIGGEVVATGRAFPSAYRTPKERWLLSELRRRVDSGEKVLVFLRHTGTELRRRILRLVREAVTGSVAFLDARRVSAQKRQGWIDKNVLEPGVKVLLVNPDAVRTGLNNLVSFTVALWFELHYSATTYR